MQFRAERLSSSFEGALPLVKVGKLAPLLISACLVAAAVVFGAIPAKAQTTAPHYSHSWYVTKAQSASVMLARGQNDGTFDNSHCTNSLAILDFGQIENESTYGYAGYGTYEFDGPVYTTVPMYTIESATENYANGWYGKTSSCPRLTLAIGTNNDRECPFGSTRGACSPSGFGYQLGNLVANVRNWIQANGMTWQITINVASDMETGYDSFAKTKGFIDGFNNHNPVGAWLYDYGDAWVNSNWTIANIYYAAYGARSDMPLPEIYTQAAASAWTSVRKYNTMYFWGVMAECHSGDPLPSGTCSKPAGQNTPTLAWNQLWNTLNANGVGNGSLDFATDINFQ